MKKLLPLNKGSYITSRTSTAFQLGAVQISPNYSDAWLCSKFINLRYLPEDKIRCDFLHKDFWFTSAKMFIRQSLLFSKETLQFDSFDVIKYIISAINDGNYVTGDFNAYYIPEKIEYKIINKVGQLTSTDCQRMYNTMKKNGREVDREHYGEGLADSTVRSIHLMFHEAMDTALRKRLIASNPTGGTVIPKNNYKEKQVLNDNQLDLYMEAIKKDPLWHDFFYLELTTGLRIGEICGLRWEDFDEKSGTLKIQRSLARTVTAENFVGDPKTEKGKRTIILPDSTYQVLLKRKEYCNSGWIFPSFVYPERPTSPSGAYHRHKTILRNLGLPDIRFHDLRHTFATHALKNNVDPKTLSGILGHTNASFTLDTYTHVTTEMQFIASEIVGDFMEEIFGRDLMPWQEEEKTEPEL